MGRNHRELSTLKPLKERTNERKRRERERNLPFLQKMVDEFPAVSMVTPLLLEAFDNDRPSLSAGGPWWIAHDESTEFSRLLEQKPYPWPETSPDRGAVVDDILAGEDGPQRQRHYVAAVQRGPWLVIAATTCTVLHFAFVWSSYVTSDWTAISIRLDSPVIPSFEKGGVLRITNLASFLQDLDSVRAYPSLVLLWITSLVIPCTFMILIPAWIIRDSNHAISLVKRARRINGRNVVECTIRGALMVAFCLLVRGVITDDCYRIEWTDTSLSIQTKLLGGMACFTAGVGSALLALFILRLPQKATLRALQPAHGASEPTVFMNDESIHVRHLDENIPVMTALEEQALEGAGGTEPPSTPPVVLQGNRCWMWSRQTDWRAIILFELGLLSSILWIPALTLPLVQWHTVGRLSPLSPHPATQRLFLWQLPAKVWQQGITAGTAKPILLVMVGVLLTTAYIIPTLAILLCIATWRKPTWKEWLYCIHPSVSSGILAVSVWMVKLSIFPTWQESLTRDVCTEYSFPSPWKLLCPAPFPLQYQPGLWILLLQSLCLELLMVLTLRWS